MSEIEHAYRLSLYRSEQRRNEARERRYTRQQQAAFLAVFVLIILGGATWA